MSTPRRACSFWFAHVVRGTIGTVIRLLFRVRVVGAEMLGEPGAAVLAGNHVSNMDPVLLWIVTPRLTHFMAKSELWENPVMSWLMDRFAAFPVRRGRVDRTAIAVAQDLLGDGEMVAIFPEGTLNRSGDVAPQGGAAFIAMRAGVPIVPVGISGTERIKPAGARFIRFPRVTISVGQRVCPGDVEAQGRKETVDAMTAEVMRRISVEVQRARKVA